MRPTVRFHRAVRVRLGPERGFLFDERTGRVYSLNATAAVAAAHLDAEVTDAEVVRAVVAAFDIDADTARRDYARFVAELVQEGLVTRQDEDTRDG
jgi:coenzyme PQQ synthesis protein D (PqqD)